MVVIPNLLFSFFSHFFLLNVQDDYPKLKKWLYILSFPVGISLLTFIRSLQLFYYLLLLATLICCIHLSHKYKTKQRSTLRQYQKVLLITFLASILPFVVTFTLLRNYITPSNLAYSIHFLILLPVMVGYLIYKKEMIQISFSATFLLLRIFAYALITLVGVTLYINNPNIILSDYINFLVFIILFMTVREWINNYAKNIHFKKILKNKGLFNKEKVELLAISSYDNYLSNFGTFIETFIQKIIPTEGFLLVLNEHEHYSILRKSGVFRNYRLNPKDFKAVKRIDRTIKLMNDTYLSFPLVDRKLSFYGWLVMGGRKDKKNFTNFELEQIHKFSQFTCELLVVSKNLHENMRNRPQFSVAPQENYLNLQLFHELDKLQKNLSHYLHDDILQNILALRQMFNLMNPKDPAINELSKEIFSQMEVSLRNKMFDLYPTTLDELGFVPSITALCTRIEKMSVGQPNFKFNIIATHDFSVPNWLKFPLFRTAKELINNGVKHANAQNITIELERNRRHVYLTIKDDGIGFDVENYVKVATEKGSIGLLSIQKDISLMGGNLSIKSIINEGTSIKIEIPIKKTARG